MWTDHCLVLLKKLQKVDFTGQNSNLKTERRRLMTQSSTSKKTESTNFTKRKRVIHLPRRRNLAVLEAYRRRQSNPPNKNRSWSRKNKICKYVLTCPSWLVPTRWWSLVDSTFRRGSRTEIRWNPDRVVGRCGSRWYRAGTSPPPSTTHRAWWIRDKKKRIFEKEFYARKLCRRLSSMTNVRW